MVSIPPSSNLAQRPRAGWEAPARTAHNTEPMHNTLFPFQSFAYRVGFSGGMIFAGFSEMYEKGPQLISDRDSLSLHQNTGGTAPATV